MNKQSNPSEGEAVPEQLRRNWGAEAYPPRLEAIRRLLKANASSAVLDYGCGKGAYVASLRSARCDGRGVDLVRYPEWDEYERQFGCSAFDVVADGAIPYEDNRFDVVFAFEVLEHCPDPLAVLLEMKRVCSGDIVVSVPDCRYLAELSSHSLALNHYTDPSHVQRFTRASLLQLFGSAGLNVRYITPDFPIDMNKYVWNSIRAPRLVRGCCRRLCGALRLFPTYYSSIRAHARKSA